MTHDVRYSFAARWPEWFFCHIDFLVLNRACDSLCLMSYQLN